MSAGTLIDELLADQQRLRTPVADFARKHDQHELPLQSRYYRDLIPASSPASGEQYAFAVDLDACSGCKACVSACHSLNGLDEGETWRDVGLLLGGTIQKPVQRTVTSACHHCVDPACLNGCPVKAYDKDPATGIVRHLDDQCIGCQYCVLKCPYEVPKYHKAKGIVRKCDMCSSRLAAGEAPACVQACPNEAIRIEVVKVEDILLRAELEKIMLPGTFDSAYTQPSTRYHSGSAGEAEMVPADAHALHPEHAHWPLIVMLVLTQVSAGLFLADLLLRVSGLLVSPWLPVAGLVVGLAGLGASILHLGRPMGAWKAFLGFRTSWLSREIIAFGMFAKLAGLYAAAGVAPPLLKLDPVNPALLLLLSAVVVTTGLVSVFCSVMVYADTRRSFWRLRYSAGKFFGTVLVSAAAVASLHAPAALVLLVIIAGLKLAGEWKHRRHGTIAEWTPEKKSALLMSGVMRRVFHTRLVLGCVGITGSVLSVGIAPLASLFLLLLICGEIVERYLFFTCVVAPRMPGGVAA